MVIRRQVFAMQGVLRCIGSTLGQSSALDFYSSKVNDALAHTQGAFLSHHITLHTC